MRKGWEYKTLGEVCEISNGSTPLRSKKEFWEDGEINWFTINDIRSQGRIINFTNQKITKEGFEKSSLKILPPKTVLLCCTASVGEYAITNIELTTNQQFNGLIVKNFNFLFPDYLFYFSSTLKEQLLDVSGKTTIDFVSMTKLKKIPIPIPPLPEQKQIVEILDQAFEAIDQAKANIEKNIVNANELFQSKLNEIFSQKGEGWVNKELSQIGEVQTGNTPPTKDKSNFGDYIPFAKPPHFKPDGSIVTGDSMLSKFGLERSRLFKKNSILMVCIGATIGKTGFSEQPISSNQQINALTPNENYAPKLLYYALISPFVQKQVLNEGTRAQATLPIINKSKWMKLKVNLPIDKEEQIKIVERLDELKRYSIKAENLYTKKLTSLEELKKSILEKAFSGELTN